MASELLLPELAGLFEGGLTMAISNKKAVEAAKVVAEYCKERKSCQNCIFRLYGCENWHCAIGAFDLQDVLRNIARKEGNGWYL